MLSVASILHAGEDAGQDHNETKYNDRKRKKLGRQISLCIYHSLPPVNFALNLPLARRKEHVQPHSITAPPDFQKDREAERTAKAEEP